MKEQEEEEEERVEKKKGGKKTETRLAASQFQFSQLTASLTARALVALSPAAALIGEEIEPLLPLEEEELEAPPLGEARARQTNEERRGRKRHLLGAKPPAAAAARALPRPLVDAAAHGVPLAADVEEGSIGNAERGKGKGARRVLLSSFKGGEER